MDSFIVFPCSKLLEFRRFIVKERKKESLDLTVDDSIDVDSVDDIGLEKLRGCGISQVWRKLRPREDVWAKWRCKKGSKGTEVGGGHLCHVKSIEFMLGWPPVL